MSKIYVDEIAGIASPSTVAIPGHVIQVVEGTTSTRVGTTSTTYGDTGLSASITPTSATSKILVVVTQPMHILRSSTVARIFGFKLLRDATTIYEPYETFNGGVEAGGVTSLGFAWVQSACKLDSPATTSSITYKTQFKVRVTSDSAGANANADSGSSNCESTIVLMEIAG